MKNAHRFLSILFAAVPLFAQEGTGATPTKARVTAAEQLFRDAWWAESGANDADAALRGYLAAVAAEGPAAVRARALLFAGRLQQKQGKSEAALAAFRRVLGEFATESAAVTEARGHLRELTAVDLRQNYDEWYERRLYSEEVQLAVLGKIEALAALRGEQPQEATAQRERAQTIARLVAELRAFGKGAVPGLRKAAVGGAPGFVDTAIELLFDLGELPPLAALLRNEDWVFDTQRIRRLFAGSHGPDRLPEPLPDRFHAHAVAAALQGPRALAERILKNGDSVDGDMLRPWIEAVLSDPAARGALLGALRQPATSLLLQQSIESAFQQWDQDVPMPIVEWIALGARPVRAETRTFVVQRAAGQLGPEDAQPFDQLLGWLAIEDTPSAGHDPAVVQAFAEGLRSNRRAELLPWTVARLQAVFIALAANAEAQIDDAVMLLIRRESTRALLVAMLFGDPIALVAPYRLAGGDDAVAEQLSRNFVGAAGTEADAQMHGRRWNAALAEGLHAAWPKYDDQARLAALVVLRGAMCQVAEKRPIAMLLTGLRAGASVPVQAVIEALLPIAGG
ncbi:MAG: hypothetical protein JNK15_23935 [Planctomycetes bacterium]|nr:hypothetical protein [Planctomycetota bacterium]